jgi:hypothetical protein
MFRLFQNLIRGTLGLLGGILNGVLGVVGLKPKKTEYFMEYKGDQGSESNSGQQQSGIQPSPSPANLPSPSVETQSTNAEKGSTRKTKARRAEPKPEVPVAVGVAETVMVPTPAPQTLNLPTSSVTFAPTYLNPAANNNGDRRRPGANMGSFLNMARQAKRPV